MSLQELCTEHNLCLQGTTGVEPTYEEALQQLAIKLNQVTNPHLFQEKQIRPGAWARLVLNHLSRTHTNVCNLISPQERFPIYHIECHYTRTKGLSQENYPQHCKEFYPLNAEELAEAVYKCSNSSQRFAIIMLELLFYRDDGESCQHANALIYDNQEQTVERYDPNGSFAPTDPYSIRCNPNDIVDIIWKDFFETVNSMYDLSIRYVGQNEYCLGLQAIQSQEYKLSKRGYCSLWTAWFLDTRLSQPNLSSKEILRRTQSFFDKQKINNPDWSYTQFILNYAKYLFDTSPEQFKEVFDMNLS